ncbi:MAG: aldolase [Neobacillus sp.]|jgi:hypothetical protein
MLNTVQKVLYIGFGFRIFSDIALPELPKSTCQDESYDIVFEKDELTDIWSEFTSSNSFFVIKENQTLFHIPNVAVYSIENGNTVKYSPADGASEDQVRLYLLGSCMGALLIQRKILPLHGSAIEINGKAYAIVGDSGAGKSTLASSFLLQGYQLLSDDIIPVSLAKGGIPVVTPAYPQQKLWQESLLEFGISTKELRPIVDRETKFAVPVSSQFVNKPIPLAGVFELVKTDTMNIEMHQIFGLERLHTLFYHTYRNFLLGPSGRMEWHFSFTTGLVDKLDFYQLRRPTVRFTANELASIILSTLN